MDVELGLHHASPPPSNCGYSPAWISWENEGTCRSTVLVIVVALGTTHAPVGDDEDARSDACAPGGTGEVFRVGQRMTAALSGRRREIGVDVEEARAGDMSREIELAPTRRAPQLPAAVDELVTQGYQLPVDGGNATEAGWIT